MLKTLEFTFQLSRLFKQNPNIKLPFRRYQIGPVFRDELISSDRFRQFTQCDADIIGSSSIQADADCLALINDIVSEPGFKQLMKRVPIEKNKEDSCIFIGSYVSPPKRHEWYETDLVTRTQRYVWRIGEDEFQLYTNEDVGQ